MSCRELFKKLNILSVPCVYIMEMVHYIKINIKLKQILAIHEYETQHRSDLQTHFCRTDIFKKKHNQFGDKII